MYTETVLRDKGMRLLISHLGNVEAERFISLMNREPFDYTQWQQDMFTGMSVRELSKTAMQEYSHVEESASKG
jgi:hypothetical protein